MSMPEHAKRRIHEVKQKRKEKDEQPDEGLGKEPRRALWIGTYFLFAGVLLFAVLLFEPLSNPESWMLSILAAAGISMGIYVYLEEILKALRGKDA